MSQRNDDNPALNTDPGIGMDIRLGKPVLSSDGKEVGKVDRIVLDANSKEVRQIIVHQGVLLTKDRIVDRPMIEQIDSDGTLHLNVDSGMVDELPPFVEKEYIIPSQEDLLRWMPHAWANESGLGAPFILAPGDYGQGYDPHGGLMQQATMNPPETEVRSNLATDAVTIDQGTNVEDKNGDKIGTVDEIYYDDDGNIAGFVVKEGFLFHHDVRVPADWVESMTPDAVRLRLSADEAESGAEQS